MQTRILIMIEMLTQNPDVAKYKHRLVQSMPLSMVDSRSTKPNKHFPLILDDFGRRCACGCNRIQEFCDRSCVYNRYNTYRLDPCSSCYNHNDVQCRVPV